MRSWMRKRRTMLTARSLSRFLATLALIATVESRADVLAYAAGDVAECGKRSAERSTAAQTAKMIPDNAVVFVVGDTAYPLATHATLESCYAPTWGPFLSRTYAVPGNHDYVNGSATDFLDYFGARTPNETWFRVQVGDWWVIGLDSNISGAKLAEQQTWLEGQLRDIEGDGRCVLAMWHHPLFSTGLHHGDGNRMRPAWAALDAARADLVLNGHEHFYESYGPRDASGHAVPVGLREIIAGTGGAGLYDLSLSGGYKKYARVHGLLELHLQKDRYDYAFRTLQGRVLDSGSAQCRRSEASQGASLNIPATPEPTPSTHAPPGRQ
jgi:3',5'-cyclic AMP phosphodiesterase CpdA